MGHRQTCGVTDGPSKPIIKSWPNTRSLFDHVGSRVGSLLPIPEGAKRYVLRDGMHSGCCKLPWSSSAVRIGGYVDVLLPRIAIAWPCDGNLSLRISCRALSAMTCFGDRTRRLKPWGAMRGEVVSVMFHPPSGNLRRPKLTVACGLPRTFGILQRNNVAFSGSLVRGA